MYSAHRGRDNECTRSVDGEILKVIFTSGGVHAASLPELQRNLSKMFRFRLSSSEHQKLVSTVDFRFLRGDSSPLIIFR